MKNFENNKINKYKTGESLISAILFFFLGVVLFTNPYGIFKFVIYILGAFSILAGIFRLLIFSKIAAITKEKSNVWSSITYILVGMTIIICSLVFFDAIELVLRLGVAAYFLYIGIIKLLSAIKTKNIYRKMNIINSLVVIFLGLGLAFIQGLPFRIVGLVIILYSIVEIINFATNNKNESFKDKKEDIKDAVVIEETEEKKLLK